MNIIKEVTQDNGVVYGYHSIAAVEFSVPDNTFRVTGNSWVNESIKAGGLRHSSSFYLIAPASALAIVDNNIKQAILDYIVSLEAWQGGVTSTALDNSFEALQQLKWNNIKAKRASLEVSGFEYNSQYFDSSLTSQNKIQGAVILAMLSISNNQPYSVDWTLQDNTTISLDAADMIQVGLSLSRHLVELHQTSRKLRETVFAATTVEELDAIEWPIKGN